VGREKPGFTERIMTVMFSKSFIIALLDNHSRVGVGLPTLEDRAHIVSRVLSLVLFSSFAIWLALRQKWMDGSSQSFLDTCDEDLWEEWL
jgi:hypothetical protein